MNLLVTFLNTSLTLISDIAIYFKLLNIKCSDEIKCAQKEGCPLKCVNCM